jgi:hypothetical protein
MGVSHRTGHHRPVSRRDPRAGKIHRQATVSPGEQWSRRSKFFPTRSTDV